MASEFYVADSAAAFASTIAAPTLSIDHIDRDWVGTILDATAAPPARHVILYGPPGTGKSNEAMAAGQRIKRQTHPVTATQEGPSASYRGHWMPKGGEFEYHVGNGTIAFASPSLLIINEIDNASPDAQDFFHVLLDETGEFETEDGRLWKRDPNYRCIATMNGYLEILRPAILDRFAVRIPVMGPSTPMLNRLDPDVRAMCSRVYAACGPTKPNPDFTYREMLNFNELRRDLPADWAALLVAPEKEKAQKLIEGLVLTTKGAA